MATQQSQAIQVANQLMSLSQQLLSIYQQMLTLDAAWTDDAVATVVAAMATTALNADGSSGAADGTPNVAHPIAQAKTIMDGIVAYVGGQAVTTQAGARAILNAVTGG